VHQEYGRKYLRAGISRKRRRRRRWRRRTAIRIRLRIITIRRILITQIYTLAFTRYCYTFSRLCTNQSSFYSSGPPALLRVHCCSTIARRLGNVRPPTQPPCCMPYTIQYRQWEYRVKAKIYLDLSVDVAQVVHHAVEVELSRAHQHVLARLFHLLNEEGIENTLEKGAFALEKGAFALKKGALACVCMYFRFGRAPPSLSARARPTLPPL